MRSAVWKREQTGEAGSDEEGTVYNLCEVTRAGIMEKVSFETVLKIRECGPWVSGKVVRQQGKRVVPRPVAAVKRRQSKGQGQEQEGRAGAIAGRKPVAGPRGGAAEGGSGWILKTQAVGFTAGSDLEDEGKRAVRVFVLSPAGKKGLPPTEQGRTEGRTCLGSRI